MIQYHLQQNMKKRKLVIHVYIQRKQYPNTCVTMKQHIQNHCFAVCRFFSLKAHVSIVREIKSPTTSHVTDSDLSETLVCQNIAVFYFAVDDVISGKQSRPEDICILSCHKCSKNYSPINRFLCFLY